MACAIVGVIIGMMTLTGVGAIFGSWVIRLGDKSLFLALIMTMLLSILLGTGIPTIPNYIITAALAAPALAKLGVPLIASHMFVFYFGIMADLTPPVALAALAAAPIAKENPDKIGWEAMRIALAGYVIPFISVYSPALMLQAGDPMAAKLGFYGAVALATFKALVAIVLFGMVAIGFLFTRLTLLERVVGAWRRALPARRLPVQRHAGLRAGRRAGALAVAAAPPRRGGGGVSLCLDLRRRREDAVARRLHAGLDAFDREDRLAGRLARHAGGPRAGAGARQGLRRRHGAAAGGAARRWLVSMAAEARADAGGRARQFRCGRRMAAMHGRAMPHAVGDSRPSYRC